MKVVSWNIARRQEPRRLVLDRGTDRLGINVQQNQIALPLEERVGHLEQLVRP